MNESKLFGALLVVHRAKGCVQVEECQEIRPKRLEDLAMCHALRHHTKASYR
jgi:hypothetical protein